jgi:hypothetical protein
MGKIQTHIGIPNIPIIRNTKLTNTYLFEYLLSTIHSMIFTISTE